MKQKDADGAKQKTRYLVLRDLRGLLFKNMNHAFVYGSETEGPTLGKAKKRRYID